MRYLLLAVAALGLSACGGSDASSGASDNAAFPTRPAQPETPPQGRFAPRNECIELPGAKSFFVALEKAVRDRSADQLLAITDPAVRLDFGGNGGLTTFRERLGTSDSRLWTQLEAILALGCAQDQSGNIVLPWYFAQDLGVEDPFSAVMVTGADVPLLNAPNDDGEAKARISWDTVTLLDGPVEGKFTHVRSRAGEEGYIASDQMRGLTAYRLTAAKSGDAWRIVSFVSGD